MEFSQSVRVWIEVLALTTDDQKLASGSVGGQVLIHSLKLDSKAVSLNMPFSSSVNKVAFYPFKRSMVAAAGDEGTVAIWDMNHSQDAFIVKSKVHSAAIKAMTFAPCRV